MKQTRKIDHTGRRKERPLAYISPGSCRWRSTNVYAFHFGAGGEIASLFLVHHSELCDHSLDGAPLFFQRSFMMAAQAAKFLRLAVSPGLGNNALSWEMPFTIHLQPTSVWK
jgi:hypothetical protein